VPRRDPTSPPTRLLVTCSPSPCLRIVTCLLPTARRGRIRGSRCGLATDAHHPAIIGEVAAGSLAAPVVTEGTCACIFTGANLPPGADTVVQVEDTRSAGAGEVTFVRAEPAGANILRQGRTRGRAAISLQRARCSAACTSPSPPPPGARAARVSPAARRDHRHGRELQPPGAVVALTRSAMPIAHAGGGFPRGGNFCSVCLPDFRRSRCVTAALREGLASADAVVLSGGVSVGAYDSFGGPHRRGREPLHSRRGHEAGQAIPLRHRARLSPSLRLPGNP